MKIHIIGLLLLVNSFCFGQISEFNDKFFNTGAAQDTLIMFEDEKIYLLPFVKGIPEQIEASFSYSKKDGIYYITINSVPVIKCVLLSNDDFGYLYIYDPVKAESGILLNNNSEKSKLLPKGGGDPYVFASYGADIKVSSCLIENGKPYTGNNIEHLILDGPWVEGKDGPGIGEYIEFDFSKTWIKKTDTFVMSNGFLSIDNPDLYYQNNRVKKIRIEDMDSTYSEEFDVLDTANLQTFGIKKSVVRARVTILDVYYGSIYNDTCINYFAGIKINWNNP
jgi:hypothetical protein